MPKGDGTGPKGQGPRTGRGKGTGSNRMGRMDGTQAGAGPDGQCVCPSCGATMAHRIGVPCYQTACPECETMMVRKATWEKARG